MADDMNLRDEDRLPWLETVEPDETEGAPVGRVVAMVLLGLAAIAVVVFAVLHFRQSGSEGNGQIIAAQQGDYKVKPDDPGGLKVVGEGDSAIATSAGKSAGNGAIDLRAVPEAPVTGTRTAAAPAAAPTATCHV